MSKMPSKKACNRDTKRREIPGGGGGGGELLSCRWRYATLFLVAFVLILLHKFLACLSRITGMQTNMQQYEFSKSVTFSIAIALTKTHSTGRILKHM